jgi:hypothetical protein
MAQGLDPITLRGFHRGMADKSVLADSMMSRNQLRLIENMDGDAIGYLKSRKGYERVGSAAVVSGESGLGLHHHIGTNSQLIAFSDNAGSTNTESYYLDGSTWTNEALGFTAGNRVRTVSFLDRVFAVNGVDAPKSWDGNPSNSWDSTNLTSAPTSALIETYKQQVFMGDTSTDQVDYSSIPSSGTITWPSDNNFIVNPNDGSNLTFLKNFANQLLIGKNDYIYRYNGRSIDADPVIFFGAPSQEAVTQAGGGALYVYDGRRNVIVEYSGGYPSPISKPVRAFLRAIPTSSHEDVVLWSDEDHVIAYIGDVTVEGVTFSKVALRYTISTQSWVVYTYAHEFTAETLYDDGTDILQLGYTSDGSVVKHDTGSTDLGEGISYKLETGWLSFGRNLALRQKLAAFSAFAESARGMNVQYKADIEDNTWRSIGQMRGLVTSWSGLNIQMHRIKFRFVGYTESAQAIFDGFSLLIPTLQGLERDTPKEL